MLNYKNVRDQWQNMKENCAPSLLQIMKSSQISIDSKKMRFTYFIKGQMPIGGYPLIFGFHGGGGCPESVNNQQYQNHLHLYDTYLPKNCIWFVPRSCEDHSDMWWKSYLEDFLHIIIQAFVLNGLANPNRIYLTGYSAGGDGIYHMAPRMADELAGAAMMAGHPNQVQLQNVRNIAFSIQVGGMDKAYNRNSQAKQYIDKIENFHIKYGGFTPEICKIFDHHGHWMQKDDAWIFPKLFSTFRNPYPSVILFRQHPRRAKSTFYYVKVNPQNHKGLMIVRKDGNLFIIESEPMQVAILVNQTMVNFKQQTVKRYPKSNQQLIKQSIWQRKDPEYIFEDYFVSNPAYFETNIMFSKKQTNLNEIIQSTSDNKCNIF